MPLERNTGWEGQLTLSFGRNKEEFSSFVHKCQFQRLVLLTHPFTQHIFLEHLSCAIAMLSAGDTIVSQKNPVFIEHKKTMTIISFKPPLSPPHVINEIFAPCYKLGSSTGLHNLLKAADWQVPGLGFRFGLETCPFFALLKVAFFSSGVSPCREICFLRIVCLAKTGRKIIWKTLLAGCSVDDVSR